MCRIVAALVWSADPTATNQEIRAALTATAHDLGAAGRDVYYGFGLVQAVNAIAYLNGGGGGDDGEVHVADITGSSSMINPRFWQATFTVTVADADGSPVSNATVSGVFSGGVNGNVACVTSGSGQCSVATGAVKVTTPITFTVTNITADGYIYDPVANVINSFTVRMP